MDKYAELSDLFRSKLESGPDGTKIAAEAGAAYIKIRLREESFARKVLPPEILTKADVQRDEVGDGVFKLIDLEPDSSAMAFNFRAEPQTKYVYGKRFRINFHQVSSQKFEKSEAELLAYESPITKIIEENTVFDIQAAEDKVFHKHSAAAIFGTPRDATSPDVSITKQNLAASRNLLLQYKLQPYAVLMTEEMFSSVLGWQMNDIGMDLVKETTISGYEHPTLLKYALIVTNKADIVSNRELWIYAKPEFLGKFFVLEDTKFWIDKRADMVEWKSWEIVGMGFGNVNGIARITFEG
jgi:hypothetical protein